MISSFSYFQYLLIQRAGKLKDRKLVKNVELLGTYLGDNICMRKYCCTSLSKTTLVVTDFNACI